ncbi:MAG TPA: hypothetical protein VEM41_09185 [Actinomycetota bacterium]|nr:hypothetical protein [Actinomycetota bacterium]
METEEGNIGMQAGDAMEMLASAQTQRRRARADLRAEWFPLVLFGILTIVSAPLYAQQLAFGGWAFPWVYLYWLVAGSLGYLAVARYFRRREAELGIGSSFAAYVWVGVGLFLYTFGLLNALPFAWIGLVPTMWLIPGFAPIVAIGAGLLALAWVERSPSLAVFGAAFSIVATLSGLYFFDNRLYFSAWYQSIVDVTVLGLILLAAGFVYRVVDRRATNARSAS